MRRIDFESKAMASTAASFFSANQIPEPDAF